MECTSCNSSSSFFFFKSSWRCIIVLFRSWFMTRSVREREKCNSIIPDRQCIHGRRHFSIQLSLPSWLKSFAALTEPTVHFGLHVALNLITRFGRRVSTNCVLQIMILEIMMMRRGYLSLPEHVVCVLNSLCKLSDWQEMRKWILRMLILPSLLPSLLSRADCVTQILVGYSCLDWHGKLTSHSFIPFFPKWDPSWHVKLLCPPTSLMTHSLSLHATCLDYQCCFSTEMNENTEENIWCLQDENERN